MGARITEVPAFRDRVFVFRDRLQAGKLLADRLEGFAGNEDVIVLAIPAGGVPVACMIAKELAVPIDVVVVRKIQIPWETEAGFGAIAWDGTTVLNENLVEQLSLTEEEIKQATLKTKKNIQERQRKFRENRSLPNLKDKVVVLVDDGLASGFTVLVAVRALKKSAPKKIVVAVPTASLGAIKLLAPETDEIVCLNIRTGSQFAVAEAYENWYDLSDEEVIKVLKSQIF